MPTFVRAKDTDVYITDSGGTARDITTFADSFDMTLESEILDTTTYGSEYKSSTRGYLGYSGSISGKHDTGATANPDQWFPGLITAAGSVTSTLTVFPQGSASGNKYERSTVYFSNYARQAPVDGLVTWSVDYQLASGSVLQGTV